MVRTLGNALVVIACIMAAGCAPWSTPQSAEYVTIQDDPRHDTKAAQKEYQVARRQMDKHLAGKRCDLAKAEEHLKQALAADVRFGPAHHSLGMLYFGRKELYLAAWEFEYAARLMPDRFEPLNNLGLVYDEARKFEQSTAYYLLAREKAPNHPHVISNLARASIRSGKSVNEIRPVLDDVLATDTRPEWRRWAGELLGLNPAEETTGQTHIVPAVPSAEPFPLPSGDESPNGEELPLIAPPMPNDETATPLIDGAIDGSSALSGSLDL